MCTYLFIYAFIYVFMYICINTSHIAICRNVRRIYTNIHTYMYICINKRAEAQQRENCSTRREKNISHNAAKTNRSRIKQSRKRDYIATHCKGSWCPDLFVELLLTDKDHCVCSVCSVMQKKLFKTLGGKCCKKRSQDKEIKSRIVAKIEWPKLYDIAIHCKASWHPTPHYTRYTHIDICRWAKVIWHFIGEQKLNDIFQN